MIDRYSLYDIQNLTDRYGLQDGVPKGTKPRFSIAPTQMAPVVVGIQSRSQLVSMSFGLVPQTASDANSVFRYKTFNVKSEKVFSKPSWETAVRTKRCIVPANGFFMQRKKEDGGDSYYFSSGTKELLSMAGIYVEWTKPDGSTVPTFAVLTIESNDAMPLPFGRMPVLLHAEDESTWLDESVQDFSSIIACMRPYEGNPLSYTKVTNDTLIIKSDSSKLVEPL
jgi:putative SOS response-associated peptidase YedK